MKRRKINKYRCPYCAAEHDAVAVLGKGDTLPTNNTFSICIECGGIVRFVVNAQNYSVRKVELTELEHLRQVAPDVYSTLMRAAILTKTRPRNQSS